VTTCTAVDVYMYACLSPMYERVRVRMRAVSVCVCGRCRFRCHFCFCCRFTLNLIVCLCHCVRQRERNVLRFKALFMWMTSTCVRMYVTVCFNLSSISTQRRCHLTHLHCQKCSCQLLHRRF